MIDWASAVLRGPPKRSEALVEHAWKLFKRKIRTGCNKKWFRLTEQNQNDENCRKSRDAVEHELQVASNQVQVVVILNEHWRQHESNSDAELRKSKNDTRVI